MEPVTLTCGHNFERNELLRWITEKTRALRGRTVDTGTTHSSSSSNEVVIGARSTSPRFRALVVVRRIELEFASSGSGSGSGSGFGAFVALAEDGCAAVSS